MTPMTGLQALVALVLATAVVVAGMRVWLAARALHLGTARATAIALLQAVAALLLYLVLFPPAATREAGVLTVLAEDGWGQGSQGRLIALPEYAGSGGERMPDLATALRRYPDTRRVIVRGTALPWRDHDAAGAVELEFDASPQAAGLVEWHAPRHVVAGQRVELQGRVAGKAGATIELLDPAGQRLARTMPDGEGRFSLPLTIHAAGAVAFRLRVLDGNDVLDEATVALAADDGRPVRVLLLAGAPSAELRALRRWAVDAGVALESRIRLSRDASLGERPGFDPGELQALDLLVLDLRSWRELDASERASIGDAAEAGLGVLLRLDDVPDSDDRASLRALGFEVEAVDAAGQTGVIALHPVHLRRDDGGGAATDPGPRDALRLTQRPVRVDAAGSATLLRSDSDAALARWRSHGLGRIAVWWLDDTHSIAQHLGPTVHANLWSMVASTLARPRSGTGPDTGVDAGVSVRRVLCGLEDGAQVESPDGRRVALLADARGCAGFWPESPGWHALRSAVGRTTFHVGEPSSAHAHAMREATRALAARAAPPADAARAPAPGSPWPWFACFLVVVSALWWLERRRGPSRAPP